MCEARTILFHSDNNIINYKALVRVSTINSNSKLKVGIEISTIYCKTARHQRPLSDREISQVKNLRLSNALNSKRQSFV